MNIDPRDLIRYEIESPMANRRAFEKKLIDALRWCLSFYGEMADTALDKECPPEFTKYDRQAAIDEYLDRASILWALCMPTGHTDNELMSETAIEQIIAARRARDRSVEPKSLSRGHAPGLRDAVEKTISEFGHPGRGGSSWKTFTTQVWGCCGVQPEATGYSARTIRGLVASLANSEKP